MYPFIQNLYSYYILGFGMKQLLVTLVNAVEFNNEIYNVMIKGWAFNTGNTWTTDLIEATSFLKLGHTYIYRYSEAGLRCYYLVVLHTSSTGIRTCNDKAAPPPLVYLTKAPIIVQCTVSHVKKCHIVSTLVYMADIHTCSKSELGR